MMRDIVKVMALSLIAIGITYGLIGLGLLINNGSKPALYIALVLIWLFTTVIFYFNR